ncbi:hypothetical protein J3F84DRAFT_379747 [Trichoderma pleuroticola]
MSKICREFLGKPIQQHSISDNSTGSVFGNALISREIVLQSILQPKKFAGWAKQSAKAMCKVLNEKDASQEKKTGRGENDTNQAKVEDKAKKTCALDDKPVVKATAGSIMDNNQAAGTFSQAYDAGYQAAYQAFQSGFQNGYEKCLEEVNSQENGEMTDKLRQSRNKHQHTRQEPLQHTDGEDNFDEYSGVLSQNDSDNDGWAPA